MYERSRKTKRDKDYEKRGKEWKEQQHLIMPLLQRKKNNGFVRFQSKYLSNVVENLILMIMLQKYPFLHKFLDEEKQYDTLEKAMNQKSRDI